MPANRKPRSWESGVVGWVWRPGVGPPGETTLGDQAYGCLTAASKPARRRGRRLAPHRSQFGHPIATLGPQPQARFRKVRCSHGGNVACRQRGSIMDNVERSFAAATAVGFVVLVIGIGLLALM
jgi:hypothetical protein